MWLHSQIFFIFISFYFLLMYILLNFWMQTKLIKILRRRSFRQSCNSFTYFTKGKDSTFLHIINWKLFSEIVLQICQKKQENWKRRNFVLSNIQTTNNNYVSSFNALVSFIGSHFQTFSYLTEFMKCFLRSTNKLNICKSL